MTFSDVQKKESSTFIKKYQFKKLSQIFIPEILSWSYVSDKKIHLKNFLVFLFLESGRNLLYTETISKFENEISAKIFKKSFFIIEINAFDPGFTRLFHSFSGFNVLKKGERAFVIKGSNRKRIGKIEKFLNDFAIFEFLNDKKTKMNIKEKKNYNHEKIPFNIFECRVRIDNIQILKKKKKKNGKDPIPKNNEKISILKLEKFEEYGNNFKKGKIYFCKKDKSIKIFVEIKNSLLKFLNFDGTFDVYDKEKVKKILIPQPEEKSLTLDFHGKIFFCGDFVRVISGIYSGNIGKIEYIYKNKIIIDCFSIKSNFRFLILNTTQVSFLCKKLLFNKKSFQITASHQPVCELNFNNEDRLLFFAKESEKNIETFSREKLVNISSENINLKKYI